VFLFSLMCVDWLGKLINYMGGWTVIDTFEFRLPIGTLEGTEKV